MKRWTFTLALTMVLLLTNQLFAQGAAEVLRPDLGRKLSVCSICGMDVFDGMLTRVDIVDENGMIHACGLGCASALLEKHKGARVEVYDCATGKMTPAMEASFVFGSRLVPARAMLPVISFTAGESAAQFQKLHGGSIQKGQSAFDLAGRIRAERLSDKKEAIKSHE